MPQRSSPEQLNYLYNSRRLVESQSNPTCNSHFSPWQGHMQEVVLPPADGCVISHNIILSGESIMRAENSEKPLRRSQLCPKIHSWLGGSCCPSRRITSRSRPAVLRSWHPWKIISTPLTPQWQTPPLMHTFTMARVVRNGHLLFPRCNIAILRTRLFAVVVNSQPQNVRCRHLVSTTKTHNRPSYSIGLRNTLPQYAFHQRASTLEAPGAPEGKICTCNCSPNCKLNWIYDLFKLETNTLICHSIPLEF